MKPWTCNDTHICLPGYRELVDGELVELPVEILPRCEAVHPVNGRRCEEMADHPWDHAYTEDRLSVASRVWWHDETRMRDLQEVEAEIEAARQLPMFAQ